MRLSILLATAMLVIAAGCGLGEPETDPITGRVTDVDGAPVPNLFVAATSNSARWRAETAADGRFSIPVPPGGTFRVETSGSSTALVVEYVASGKADLELQFPRLASVSGTLVDAAGAPLAGRFLVLHAPYAEVRGPHGVRATSSGGSVTTAADGTFRIDGLLPGPHVVDLPADVPPGVPQLLCTAEVVEAPAADLRLVATEGAVIEGVLLDPEGAPTGGEVNVGRRHVQVGPDAPELRLYVSKAVADAAGRFRLTGLPPGPVEISAQGRDWTSVQRTVEAPAADVELRLEPPLIPLTRGRIVGADGRPLANASLRFTSEERSGWTFFGGTDEAGRFVQPSLREGTFTVEVLQTPGDGHGPGRRVGVVEAGATDAELRAGD